MTPIPLSDTSRPPQLGKPCWAFNGYWKTWEHFKFSAEAKSLQRLGYTHWHPDQPDAPTERPDNPWSTSPEVDAIAAHVEATSHSDTPRTDAAAFTPDDWEQQAVFADFARTLERELAEAHKECEEQARLNGMGAEREAGLHGRIAELERELAATKALLEAQLTFQRELRADRDRLDWLGKAKCAYFHEGPFCWRINEDDFTDGDTIRAAIDAAMQKQEGGV